MFLRLFTVPRHSSLESLRQRVLLKADGVVGLRPFKALSTRHGPRPPKRPRYSQFLPSPKSVVFTISRIPERKGILLPKHHSAVNPSLGMIIPRRSFHFPVRFTSPTPFGHLLFLVKVLHRSSSSSPTCPVLLSINRIAAPYPMYIAHRNAHTFLSLSCSHHPPSNLRVPLPRVLDP